MDAVAAVATAVAAMQEATVKKLRLPIVVVAAKGSASTRESDEPDLRRQVRLFFLGLSSPIRCPQAWNPESGSSLYPAVVLYSSVPADVLNSTAALTFAERRRRSKFFEQSRSERTCQMSKGK